MHVLLTTDSVGGVWTYTEELSTGLVRNGHQVTLVSFGYALDEGQRAWLRGMRSPRFQCMETEYRLEWMDNAAEDLARSSELLRGLAERLQPDLLHSNQFAYGDLSDTLPVLVTGHSDVLSWWQAVHGEGVPDTGRMRAYAALVRSGLRMATRLAAPTAWMARELREQYGIDRPIEVIPNGRSPELFLPDRPKSLQAITVGRAWDPGKHVALLEEIDVPMPLLIAGEPVSPVSAAHVPGAPAVSTARGVTYLGKQDAAQLQELYSRTAIYIATSRYEPFGLAPLEGALSGCALVLSDLPTLREIWSDAAIFYPAGDARSLERILRRLAVAPQEVDDLAARALARARTRYSASAMVTQHEALYGSLVRVTAV
jgi:glycogen(starch) synthase